MAIRPTVVWRDGREGGTRLSAANINTILRDAGAYIDERVAAIPQGPPGPPGGDGADGAPGSAGAGVPVGGASGQVLAKSSGTDLDTRWVTPLALGTTSTTALRGDYSPPADAAAGTASMRRLGTGAGEAAPGASAVGRVAHGSTAGAARPSGYATVIWVGSVEPTNRATGDLWVRTA